ncbi:MAG: acetyl-CoA C-acetyltransferase [Firmicutes bacterium]|nr:acetyl-CoA C-acetyltransferase [Bacillota bacterium]
MTKVYIVEAKRTATASFLGSLKGVHPADLGATLIKNILTTTKVPAAAIDEVIVGNILTAGLGQGLARQISIKGGVPFEVPAYSISMACGSAMKAIMNGVISIQGGYDHLVLAGGVESMSRAPYLLPDNARGGIKMGEIKMKDHMLHDALTDAFSGVHMGVTAENIAEKYSISRADQDAFAIDSQKKAIAAVDSKRFADEIVPIEVKVGKDVVKFDTDEYPNRTTSLEKLAALRPAFKPEGGTVTAGNSSGLNDGGSMLLLASEEAVKKYNLKPLVEIVGIGQGGVDPQLMGLGPTPAIKNALKHAHLKFTDLDLIELNEAFAAQSLGVIHELTEAFGVTKEDILKKTNVNGGAIALGHAVGGSGARITVTLIHELLKRQATYGIASLCIGGGMGTAIIVKRV